MIESLSLTNFKNFRKATLPLDDLTVLVGANASGKSNLRDALRFVHGMSRGYSLAEIIGEKWGEGGFLQWSGIRGGTRDIAHQDRERFSIDTVVHWNSATSNPLDVTPVDLLFWNSPFKHSIEVDVADDKRGPRIVRESLHRGEVQIYSTISDEITTYKSGREAIRASVSTSAETISGLVAEVSPRQPLFSQIIANFNNLEFAVTSVRHLTDSLKSMRFFDPEPEKIRIPSLTGQTILGDRGENLSSVLQGLWTSNSGKNAIVEWIRQLTPVDVVDLEFPADQAGRILLTLIESENRRTSAQSASDGTLRFLAIIAALFSAKQGQTLVFEEIENGIHPTRLYLLLQLIEQNIQNRGVQVVVTTHSPQLLGFLSKGFQKSAVLVYRRSEDPEGHAVRLGDLPNVDSILDAQNLSRLHESGWMENAVEFLEGSEAVQ